MAVNSAALGPEAAGDGGVRRPSAGDRCDGQGHIDRDAAHFCTSELLGGLQHCRCVWPAACGLLLWVPGQADVLSLHAPLTPQTQNLINAEWLRWLKPTARLVNMARGGLVQLDDLCAALRSWQLAGAALDVLPVEPPGSPAAVWCTPWRAICRPTSPLKRLSLGPQLGTARGE